MLADDAERVTRRNGATDSCTLFRSLRQDASNFGDYGRGTIGERHGRALAAGEVFHLALAGGEFRSPATSATRKPRLSAYCSCLPSFLGSG